MYWTLGAVVVALAGFLLFNSLSRATDKHGSLPPGPPDVSLPGSPASKAVHLHQKLAAWMGEYGDVFSFTMGRSEVVVLNSPRAIEDLLVKKGQIYSSRPTTSKQADIITGKARIVNMPYGETFRKHRKLVHSLLGMQNAKIFLPYQEYESRQTMQNLLDNPDLFFREVQRYSASVTFSLLVGARFHRSDAYLPTVIGKMMEKFFNNIRPGTWLVDRVPLLDHLPNALAPWRGQARAIFDEIQDFWSVFLSAIESRVHDGTAPDCFLSRFLHSPEVAHFSEVERITITAELLTAGTETTGTTLQWFFKAAVSPKAKWVMEAQRELDTVVGPDRLPDWSDRANLPYIDAVVSELHRWASAAPLAFFHATSEADTYRGNHIPKATPVIPNTYAIHHDPDVFPAPSEFLPERWLPTADPRHLHDGARTPSHFAFGAGRRECPGRHVADASLYIAISRILWGFDISLGGHRMPGDETSGSLPVLGPAPFRCEITPRSESVAQKIRDLSAFMAPELTVEDGSTYDDQIKSVLAKHRKR